MLHKKDVSSRFGAPMGRMDTAHPGDCPEVITVVRVPLVDGCYDEGGAYWGAAEPLYEYEYEYDGEVCNGFLRAARWDAVVKELRGEIPGR
jgi:hypothetical protein